MKYNPNIHNRQSIRLKGYDYSQAGLYFITTCIQNRACLLGNVTDGKMILNNAGTMVKIEWLALPKRFPNIKLHEYIIMPNHFHAILEITDEPVGATLVVAQNNEVAQNNPVDENIDQRLKGNHEGLPRQESEQDISTTKKTLGDMVGAFESITTNEYIRGVKNNNWPRFNKKLWQRNYWEHIIRAETDYYRIANYIIENPGKWNEDKFNQNE